MCGECSVGPDTKVALRSLPWGLLGMVLLVFFVERYSASHEDAYLAWGTRTWKHAATAARVEGVGRDVLYFGDSQVKFGVLPRVI